ncbi:MAG: hypothetical protein M1834_003949 [Cirrosporium novae-zelandiae]|nr:MAG: hypothetical protein M1834_003949 [Cirrosporium novae-zelandiae]
MVSPLAPLSESNQNLRTPKSSPKKSSSPAKSMSNFKSSTHIFSSEHETMNSSINSHAQPSSRSPRKAPTLSPGKRSPSKPTRSPPKSNTAPNLMNVDEDFTLRSNEGLTQAINMMQYENESKQTSQDTVFYEIANEENHASDSRSESDGLGDYGGDDTCLSSFSVIPNADVTERLRQPSPKKGSHSPTKRQYDSTMTPRGRSDRTPGTVKRYRQSEQSPSPSPSPTPRLAPSMMPMDEGNTTNLIDITESLNAWAHPMETPSRTRSPGKKQSYSNLASVLSSRRTPSSYIPPATPSDSRHIMNLIDFDIPPAPTPRSIPTITARELESLKSSFASQISSLRATLNGKEAEISSLKEAVGDAERRVGEVSEELRDLRDAKEAIEGERNDWEKQAKDTEGVLRSAKEEIFRINKEREELGIKLEESEHRREEAEGRAADAQQSIAKLKASTSSPTTASTAAGTDGLVASTPSRSASKDEIEEAVEKVARELHSLYKEKHEHKVSALKRSYEARWEKKTNELKRQVEEANKELDALRTEKESTFSGVVTKSKGSNEESEEEKKAKTEQAKKFEEQKARLAGLSEEIESFKRENTYLREELEAERVEKGELVAAVEEMLEMSVAEKEAQAQQAQAQKNLNGHGAPAPSTSISTFSSSTSGPENPRGGAPRTSGLKGPSNGHHGHGFKSSVGNAGESRIGRVGSGGSNASGHSRNGSGFGGGSRSGIMSSIERMGRGRGTE